MGVVQDSYPYPSSPNVSAVMRRNLKTESKPEVLLRSQLHRRGLRYRKNKAVRVGDLVTYPDVVFGSARIAVFVDGCFWHKCPEHGTQPKANSLYWREKLERNVARDRRVDAAMTARGWRVVRVWEHESPDRAASMVHELVAEKLGTGRAGRHLKGLSPGARACVINM